MGLLTRAAQTVVNAAWGAVQGARVGAVGGRVKASVMPAYDAGGTGRRLNGWSTTSSGINTIIVGQGTSLRSRARDLVRRNPWAASMVNAYVDSAVGTGIKPRSRHPDEKIRQQIHDAWNWFCDDADADGRTDFYGLQSMAFRAMYEAGECFARLRPRRPKDGLAVPLQVQNLESEQVPLDLNRPAMGGNVIRAGIEFDAIGRRRFYHAYRSHPGEALLFGGDGWETRPIPAEQVLHVYRTVRPGQIRGVTWMAPAMMLLYELDQCEDAQVVRQKLNSMFTGTITPTVDESGVSPLGPSVPTDDPATIVVNLQPGTFPVLRPGEEVKFAEPADMAQGWKEFGDSIKRGIAAGGEVPFEWMTGDLSGVNYSSIRAGLLKFRRAVEVQQFCTFVPQYCRPTWREFLAAAAMAGKLSAGDLMQNRGLYMLVDWVPPGWLQVDPEKEFKATILAIRAGLMSRTEAVAARGYDIEDIDRAIAEEQRRADDLGLAFDSDGRRKSGAGASSGGDGSAGQDGQGGDTESNRTEAA